MAKKLFFDEILTASDQSYDSITRFNHHIFKANCTLTRQCMLKISTSFIQVSLETEPLHSDMS